MESLTLQNPCHLQLEKNAAPALDALDRAIAKLQDARNAWSVKADNRQRIREIADLVAAQAAELAEVDDADREMLTADAARSTYCDTILSCMRSARFYSSTILTEQEGTSTVRKRLKRALEDVSAHVAALRSGLDVRQQITEAVTRVKAQILEFQILDENVDGWAPKMAVEQCDTALRLLSEPPKTSPHVQQDSRPANQLRQRLCDAIDEARSFMGSLTNPAEEGAQQRQAVLHSVHSLRVEISRDFFSPLEDAELAEVKSKLLGIRRDVNALPRLPAIARTPLGRIIDDQLQAINIFIDRTIIGLIDPRIEASPATTSHGVRSLLDRVFGREN